MDKEVFITGDGSHSISVPALNASYHSSHGALQESKHIFIEAGLKFLVNEATINPSSLSILEIGFGTGLNALLTVLETIDSSSFPSVYYEAVEAYPLEAALTKQLNYSDLLNNENASFLFAHLHSAAWGTRVSISDRFTLHKRSCRLQDAILARNFDLIYFDAFAPEVQPELWTLEIFNKLYAALTPGGALVTYCSKSMVRRTMEAVGFMVEKLPGPKGKREIVRAIKR